MDRLRQYRRVIVRSCGKKVKFAANAVAMMPPLRA
jgi:hypothetical protein